jgi:hypothetical protein
VPPRGFDPNRLTGEASLNKVVIVRFAGVDVGGVAAVDACSREALLALARSAGLPRLSRRWLADDLGHLATSADPTEARAATETLEAFGRRLGALVATLRRAATPAEQGNTHLRLAYLEHWLTVDRVWLAGGLVQGPAGDAILRGARAVAARAERPCPLELGPYRALGPLVGAARRAAGDVAIAAVADLGHSSIKTAIALIEDRRVVALDLLAASPVPPVTSAALMADAVVDALTEVARRARTDSGSTTSVTASVASYVADGIPIDDGRSVYSKLGGSMSTITEAISSRTGRDVSLRFVHDGTAAASSTGDAGRSGTITAGTRLGVGFTPPEGNLRDLHPDFAVRGELRGPRP